MRLTLQDRLLQRELGDNTRFSGVRGIYGDRRWIDDLDIVNELGGHTGCVNALSWSKSGRLLASGSDDVHLNIHSYQPDSSTTPFALSTSISTGHRANIFSVKFMPHSDDRTLVTAAGDSEVRVFDIEYSGRSTIPSSASTAGNQRIISGYNKVYNGVRHLSDGDTNCLVFRSHSDRVKRIVTVIPFSVPYMFRRWGSPTMGHSTAVICVSSAPKLGLASRTSLLDHNDAHSTAAMAMAGLAGHSEDDITMYQQSQGVAPMGDAPINAYQMSYELSNWFEAAGHNLAFASQPQGELSASAEVFLLFGNEEELSRIMKDCF